MQQCADKLDAVVLCVNGTDTEYRMNSTSHSTISHKRHLTVNVNAKVIFNIDNLDIKTV